MKSYNELLEGAKSLLKDATHTKSGLNSNHNNGNNSNVLIAAVIGLAAGAILGILLAPERGADTRNNISNSLNNLLKGLIAGYGAKKLGGGCLSTIIVFVIIWIALGQC